MGEPGHGDNLTLSSDSDENDIFTRASPNPVKGNKPGGEVTKWQPLLWRRSSSATGSGDAAMVEKPVLLPFPPSSFRREQVGVGGKKPRDVEGAFTEERKLKPISRWAVRGRQVTDSPFLNDFNAHSTFTNRCRQVAALQRCQLSSRHPALLSTTGARCHS